MATGARRYVKPGTRSLFTRVGMLNPAASHGIDNPELAFHGMDNVTEWTPYTYRSAQHLPTRTQRGDFYMTPTTLWDWANVRSRFLTMLKIQPVGVKLATGRWTPGAHVNPPLPSLPAPGRIIEPRF